jgi:flagellar hook-basal body complex protein FliE
MTNPIFNPVGPDPLAPLRQPDRTCRSAPCPGTDFKSILLNSLNEVNRLQTEADQKVQALYRGETENVADVFAAVNKAGIAFDLLMEIRNKLVEAYQEIQSMRF